MNLQFEPKKNSLHICQDCLQSKENDQIFKVLVHKDTPQAQYILLCEKDISLRKIEITDIHSITKNTKGAQNVH